MAISATRDDAVVAGGRRRSTACIDCDIHELLLTPRELKPYLAEPWADWVTRWPGLYHPPHVHPLGGGTGARAADAGANAGSKAGLPGVDYELMAREHLDKNDVRYAVLGGLFYPAVMKTQPDFAVALASAYNDWQIEHWLSRDERLRGSVQVAPQDPAAAAREIDRVGKHPSMVQVMLPIVDFEYGAPQYHPIFEAAVRNGLAVAFHQSGYTTSPFGLMRYQIAWHCAFPLAFMGTLISLVFSGVFDKYSELRVIMLEGGFTWLPSFLWRLDQQYKSLHVEVPWVKQMPSDTLRRSLRLATQPMEDIDGKQLMTLFELCQSDEFLVFASDYPHWDSDEADRVLPSGIPPDVVEKIMFGNAASFYGFSVPDA